MDHFGQTFFAEDTGKIENIADILWAAKIS